ncbi:hypothetical protein DER44DRAFT_459221 [Fusarium oxysporum]|nr:hypothetical protein DER44DRAFT_459221 [Fusarium oxysporum]
MTAMAGQLAGPRWLVSPSTSPVLYAMAPLLFSSYNTFAYFFLLLYRQFSTLGSVLVRFAWYGIALLRLVFDSSPIYFSLIFCRIVQFGFQIPCSIYRLFLLRPYDGNNMIWHVLGTRFWAHDAASHTVKRRLAHTRV